MAQTIKQGNIFGRLGSGIGQGLAEQIPKEVERNRLASGLAQFEKDYQNLTQMQQLARLTATGAPPQTVQAFSELAKRQNLTNAYGRAAGRGGMPNYGMQQQQSSPQDVQFGQSDAMRGSVPSQQRAMMQQGYAQQQSPQQTSQTPSIPGTEYSPPQIQEDNPLAEQNQPRIPWNSEKINDRTSEYISMGFTPEEARQLALEDSQRYMAEPAAYRERRDYLKGVKETLKKDLDAAIERKLQKTGDEKYSQFTGDMSDNFVRGASRDLRLNKKATEDDVVNDWAGRALDMAKAHEKFQNLAKTTGIEGLTNTEVYDKLKTYSKIYRKAGAPEEFKDMLKDSLGMSEQGAASIAMPMRPEIGKYVNSTFDDLYTEAKKSKRLVTSKDSKDIWNKIYSGIASQLKPDDSIQAIAAHFSNKHKYQGFSERDFFNALTEEMDELPLTGRQRAEIAEGVPSRMFNWGDIMILPFLRSK